MKTTELICQCLPAIEAHAAATEQTEGGAALDMALATMTVLGACLDDEQDPSAAMMEMLRLLTTAFRAGLVMGQHPSVSPSHV